MDLTTERLRSEEDGERDDFISEMPDEVLGMILSRLSLKEAARTTVLSRRWISALHLFSGVLSFDSSLLQHIPHQLSYHELQLRFVGLVNKILFSSLRSPTFQKFILSFLLCFESASDMDNWLLFAFHKRVEMLDFNLFSCAITNSCQTRSHYAFPLQLFHHSTFTSLKCLRFQCVEVSEEAIHWFLNHCVNLEELRLGYGCLIQLETLRISVPSLKLTHLDLLCHDSMTDLNISAGTLVSLDFSAPHIRLSLEMTPSLVQVGFQGSFVLHLIDYPTQFSSILTKLKSLKLFVPPGQRWKHELLQLNNIKQLVLTMFVPCGRPFKLWSTFLKGAPLLQQLVIKFEVCPSDDEPREPEKVREESPYKELKEVKIHGYQDDVRIHEFIFYLVENSLSLEKIVIDTWVAADDDLESYEAPDCEARRESALRLKSQLPVTLSFIIVR